MMFGNRFLFFARIRVLIIVLGWLSLPSQGRSQTRVLDDFDTLQGWKAIVSEGAKLDLVSGQGKSGKAMVMEFDLSGVYGYTIAQREFLIDLPSNYQFTFDMRAEAPVNNFEFKLIDDQDNVFWVKKLNYTFPHDWSKQRIKKRHLTFAWGPARGGEIRRVRKIEFVVSVATGGKGKVWIDNFRFDPIVDDAGKNAVAEVNASTTALGTKLRIDSAGTVLSAWQSSGEREEQYVTLDFHRTKEVGGIVVEWDSLDYAASYDILLSDDGQDWTKAYEVKNGGGGRHALYLHDGEGRFLKMLMAGSSRGRGYRLRRLEVKGPEFSASPNDFFRSLGAQAAPGLYPKYLLNRQSYWTVAGVSGDTKEALMNEQGQIEVDKLQFSLEPFLYVDGRLVTWSDVTTIPSLLDGYLPIPSVTWNYQNLWTLTIQAVAAGAPGNSLLGVRYSIVANSTRGKAKLFIALRPFQVNPPWQALNVEGGVSRIDSMTLQDGIVKVNTVSVIPMTAPSGFGAVEFDRGDITGYLAQGRLPDMQETRDHFGHASGALEFDLDLVSGEPRDVFLVVPFHGWRGSPTPNMARGSAETYYSLMLKQTAQWWEDKLSHVSFGLPPAAKDLSNTFKSNLAYIFVNRDGPGIQPGSRSYERSWIRDGSLTCSALLRTGNREEVREFLDWYAKGQFPSGKIPCVIDARGPDAVPEHDSHGQFIYAVLQYYLFSKDTTWLRGKFDAVVKTVRYIQSLRAERKTEVYRNGTPVQRACYGLVPESISHEGYWDVPRHSYWDGFFVLRGLKDATTIAAVVGDKALEAEFAAERDDFRKDLYASMRLAIANAKIDYIPGCVELGDFDATSTTIGISPGGELGNIPEPELHNTFDRYYRFFVDRKKYGFVNYTPYETRVIGTFVLLGQKQRAEETLEFFMHDRRPPAWNHWAEVVWQDPETPKYIGDMPHTWVGSDFIRSVLAMFVHEREKDDAHVLCEAIPDAWVNDPAGVQVGGLETTYGTVGYTLRRIGSVVRAEVSGTFDAAHHKLVLHSPLSSKLRSVKINGRSASTSGEIVLRQLPAKVELSY
jgi:hypothetical protein